MFLESILFLQKELNFQKQCCPVLATWSQVSLVACPQSRAHTIGFQDSLAGYCLSREKYLENFSKNWVFRFLTTQTSNLFTGESSSHEGYTEMFAAPFVTSLRVELSVMKKT